MYSYLCADLAIAENRLAISIGSPTPYQVALMQQFRVTADAKKQEAQEQVKQLLVGAGVIAALFGLLSNAQK